jgi:hypothetical protein
MDHQRRIMLGDLDAPRQVLAMQRLMSCSAATPDRIGHGAWQPHDWWRDTPEAESRRRELARDPRLVGALRAARLYAGTIIVTDSQLFDGFLLQAAGPAMVLTALGQDRLQAPVLRIVARASTLSESLVRFVDGLVNPDLHHRTLASVLGEATPRGDSAPHAGGPHVGRPFVLGGVGRAQARRLAESRGWPADALDGLGNRWQEWLDAAEAADVDSAVFTPFAPAELERAFVDLGMGPGRTDETEEEVMASIRSVVQRSRARRQIDESSLDDDRRQRLTADYDSAYLLAQARSHGAALLSVMDLATASDTVSRASEKSKNAAVGRQVMLRGEAPEQLGSLPAATYMELGFRHRKVIERWRRADAKAEIALATAIDAAASFEDVDADRRRTRIGLIATVGLAFLTFALESLSVIGGWWAFTVPCLAFVVTMFPAVLGWVGRRREERRAKATLSIHVDRNGS